MLVNTAIIDKCLSSSCFNLCNNLIIHHCLPSVIMQKSELKVISLSIYDSMSMRKLRVLRSSVA